jgi:hypothetical protein
VGKRRLSVDLTPLRSSRDFSLVFTASGVSAIGSFITYVSIPYQVFVLRLALLMLVLAGAADMVSGLFRMTIWNQTVPHHLRGRLAGIEMLSYSSGPTLGNLESGVVARFAGVGGSIVWGGVLCVVGTVALAAALPEFRRYDGQHGLSRKVAEDQAWAAKAALAPAPGV